MSGRFFSGERAGHLGGAGATALAWLHRFSRTIRHFARRNPLGMAGGVIVLVMTIVAIFAPLIAPFGPLETHFDDRFLSPRWPFLFGTDDFGRDQLSRLIIATRSAMYVAVVSIALGITIGGVTGVVGAYLGGWLDISTQRVMDGLLAFPILILALAVVAMLGPQDINVIISIAIVNLPIGNRVMRAVTLSAKEELYVEAARAIGASDRRIIFGHIVPNILAPYIVVFTSQIAWAIIVAASLSFLGVASPPPVPSWGGMLSEGTLSFAERAPWLAIFPGIVISITVLGFHTLGDALRDALDPRLRGG